ncbi:MAG: hypothetical protein IKR21_00605 [Oscillospiraceae bacterium]|nr:hypothetical protein [Oscillospiraceae bacterium]
MGKSLKDYGNVLNINPKDNKTKPLTEEDYVDEEDPVLTVQDDIQLSEIPISPMILEKEVHKGHLIALRSQEEFIYIVENPEKERFHLFTHTFGEEAAGRRDCRNDENSMDMIKQMIKVADAAYSCIYCKELALPDVMAAMEQGIISRFPEVEKRVVKTDENTEAEEDKKKDAPAEEKKD